MQINSIRKLESHILWGMCTRACYSGSHEAGLTRYCESRGCGHEGVLLEFRAGGHRASRREGARDRFVVVTPPS